MNEFMKSAAIAVLSGGIGGSGVTYLSTVYQADTKARQEIVNKILQDDLAVTKTKASLLRLVKELELIREHTHTETWDQFVAEHPDKLPRFYLSGSIWSRFHSEVFRIKQAYKALGLLPGEPNDKADGDFVIATMKFQIAQGEKADGIVGPNTLQGIIRMLKERGVPSPWDPRRG